MAMHWTENLPICSTDEAWGSSPLNKCPTSFKSLTGCRFRPYSGWAWSILCFISCMVWVELPPCVLVGCPNLTAWCSGPRGYALTRDVLLLDAVRLCVGMPARSTVCRDGDEIWVEDG
ncbi:unnamed protein product [Prunus armeniaca]